LNILFTICARAGSKGIKNKNIKKFLDYPLSYYTLSVIDLYQKHHHENNCDIVLNTDSKELISMILNEVSMEIEVIERESSLGKDDTPKINVIRDCLFKISAKKQINYNMVIDLDITSPLRTLSDLENLIKEKNKDNNDVVFSVTNSRRNPYFNMVKKGEKGYERAIQSKFNARQEAPEILDMNASLYAFSPNFLNESMNMFDVPCGIIKMKDTGILDLDSEDDFELMQVIARYLFDNYSNFEIIKENIKNLEC